jgi:hypothetical protein
MDNGYAKVAWWMLLGAVSWLLLIAAVWGAVALLSAIL